MASENSFLAGICVCAIPIVLLSNFQCSAADRSTHYTTDNPDACRKGETDGCPCYPESIVFMEKGTKTGLIYQGTADEKKCPRLKVMLGKGINLVLVDKSYYFVPMVDLPGEKVEAKVSRSADGKVLTIQHLLKLPTGAWVVCPKFTLNSTNFILHSTDCMCAKRSPPRSPREAWFFLSVFLSAFCFSSSASS